MASVPGRRELPRWVWPGATLLLVGLHLLLNEAVILPYIYQLNPLDGADYIVQGRAMMNSISEHRFVLPDFQRNPLLFLFYGVIYLPFHDQPFWFIQVEWVGRLLCFVLLWVTALLVARELRDVAHPAFFIVPLFLAPVIPGLLSQNLSDALFAITAGLACWQLLAFRRQVRVRNLAGASGFLGVAAFCRNDALVLYPIFLVLVVAYLVGHRDRVSRVEGARLFVVAASPFLALVGVYLLALWLLYGHFSPGPVGRMYDHFELAQSVIYGGSPDQIEAGVLETRRIFGTPEENGYSVATAARRNPGAFVARVGRLLANMPGIISGAYGGRYGIVLLGLAVGGIVVVLRRRAYWLAAILVGWPEFLAVYLAFQLNPRYVLLPFVVVFGLAAVGLATVARLVRVPRRVGVALGAAAVVGALLLRGPFPPWQVPRIGASGEEQSALYLIEHLPRGSGVGAYGPAVVAMAKMDWAPVPFELSAESTPADLEAWIARHQVKALYVDYLLEWLSPAVATLIDREVGSRFTEVYDVEDLSPERSAWAAEIQRAFGVTPSPKYRILLVR